jgi:hypothetical protein
MMNLSPAFSTLFGFFAHKVMAQTFVPQRAIRVRTDPSSRAHSPFGVADAKAETDIEKPAMKVANLNFERLTRA